MAEEKEPKKQSEKPFHLPNERLEKIIDDFGCMAIDEPFRAAVYLDSFIPDSVNKKPFYAAVAQGLARYLDHVKEGDSQRESLQMLIDHYRNESSEYFQAKETGSGG